MPAMTGVQRVVLVKDPYAIDVQVTLWDKSVVSGQLKEQALTCTLESGVSVPVQVVYGRGQGAGRPMCC